MRSYRMVTPKNADVATLRWVADHAQAIADDHESFSKQLAAKHPGEAGSHVDRAHQMCTLARSLRVRAARIENAKKRGKR
jgi:hypothetical protein